MSMKKVLEWGLAITAIGASMAFGGVQPVAYSVMGVDVFLFLLLQILKQFRSGKVGLPLSLWPLLFLLVVALPLVTLRASQIIGAASGQLWKHRAA